MHDRTKKLFALMQQHQLKIRDVAEITHRTEKTVKMWRIQNTERVIPSQALRLLELEMRHRSGELPLEGGKPA